MLRIFIFFSFSLLFQFSIAQTFEPIQLPFEINGDNLKHTLAGGLNSPQFSKVDLNNDGTEDLYIFDKSNNAHLPFLITEESGEITYTYAYEFARNFPECKAWVALRDYNGDGIADLFTVTGTSQVFKGKYENGKIAFEPVISHQGKYLNFLTYYKSDGSIDFIPLFADDYPVIEDIDGDGDLDVLAFGGQTSVNYFRNTAIENGYPLDSLTFILADDCWGRFSRSSDNEPVLSTDINKCADGLVSSDDRVHLSLTLMVYDEDNDGDMEGIVGAATSPNFSKLTNTGSTDIAFMTEATEMFPDYDVPVNVLSYPTGFYIDIDNDDVPEFLAAPNHVENGEDLECSWLYKNVGSMDNVVWEQERTDFLVGEMLDLGSNATPAFVDYNADGLMDMVVGTGGEWLWTKRGSIALFENIGTATEPEFKLIDDNWLDFNALVDSLSKFAPAFGDLDNDGDEDLLVGTTRGDLIYVENVAGAGNPVVYEDKIITWKNILPGSNSVPQIGDLNRDGLPDLLIGVRNGRLRYFPNIGSPNNPNFEPDPFTAPNDFSFGDIDAAGSGNVIGNATPFLIDRNTHFSMLLATSRLGLEYYEFSKNDLNDDIFSTLKDLGELRMGYFLYPAVEDLNDDGFLELVVGNRRGGLTIFGSDLGVTSAKEIPSESSSFISPNPCSDVLFVQSENSEQMPSRYLIYNNLGQLVKTTSEHEISVSDLPAGVYFLEIQSGIGKEVLKFLKQ